MPEATNSLDAELRALAGELRTSQPADGLADAVLLRIGAEPVPGRPSRFAQTVRRVLGWLLARWRSVVAALGVLLIGLALAPPVRATVAEWFGFDGVIVRREPGPVPSTTPAPPVASSNLTLDQARRLLRFAPLVPAALGPPSGVEVSADRRVLSMTWTGGPEGTIRLDEFDGRLDWRFAKTVHADVRFVEVGGWPGLWFPVAHEVAWLDADGTPHTQPPRLAAPTLVWEQSGTTLRLEGRIDLARATAIATSVR